ncbi:hypothetical protein KP509_19G052500 [Ceratopteris richardii]|nr:hypothetical protein KP509_19G052500 [Ceratopteris richardii]KAH7352576.1 hypothetical protein KP509_19G052500 [Ceratopteris richardii]KAH7352577.1 hypothetical protein KP509_19G052500 [Ceratopteris richardii]
MNSIPAVFGLMKERQRMRRMAALVEKATCEQLNEPDWGLNLDICDSVNQNRRCSGEVAKAVKKRLRSNNVKEQMLALVVLEMIMKNCGDPVHRQVAEKDVLRCMIEIVKQKEADGRVRERILVLLNTWKMVFGGPNAKYPQYSAAHEELQRSGALFPGQVFAGTAPFVAPIAKPFKGETTETNYAASLLSIKNLVTARQSIDVLKEMLDALDPTDKKAIHDDVVMQLVGLCENNKKIVMQLMNSTSNESLRFHGLSLSDDLEQVLARYSSLVRQHTETERQHTETERQHTETEETSKSSGEAIDNDEEEDETEEETCLIHRSRSKPNCTCGAFPETKLQSRMEYSCLQRSRTPADNHQLQIHVADAFADGQVASIRNASVPFSGSSMTNPVGNIGYTPTTVPLSSSSTLRASQRSQYGQSSAQQINVSDRIPSSKWSYYDQNSTNAVPYRDYTFQPTPGIIFDIYDDEDDVMENHLSNLRTRSFTTEKISINNELPPPPKLHVERGRFFEERQEMIGSPNFDSTTINSMEHSFKTFDLDDMHDKQAT